MRVLHLTLFFSVLALAACTSVAAPDQDLAKLKGRPVQPVIAKLGAPGSEQKTDGGTSYGWTIETRVEAVERMTTTEYSAGRPNEVETTALVPRMQSCTLRLLVDRSGLITAVEQDGPYQACGAFAAKLKGER
jgi:hypothetical protein